MNALLRRLEALEAQAHAAPVDPAQFILTDLEAAGAPWNPNHAQSDDREIWRDEGELAEEFRARALATFSDSLQNVKPIISIGRKDARHTETN